MNTFEAGTRSGVQINPTGLPSTDEAMAELTDGELMSVTGGGEESLVADAGFMDAVYGFVANVIYAIWKDDVPIPAPENDGGGAGGAGGSR